MSASSLGALAPLGKKDKQSTSKHSSELTGGLIDIRGGSAGGGGGGAGGGGSDLDFDLEDLLSDTPNPKKEDTKPKHSSSSKDKDKSSSKSSSSKHAKSSSHSKRKSSSSSKSSKSKSKDSSSAFVDDLDAELDKNATLDQQQTRLEDPVEALDLGKNTPKQDAVSATATAAAAAGSGFDDDDHDDDDDWDKEPSNDKPKAPTSKTTKDLDLPVRSATSASNEITFDDHDDDILASLLGSTPKPKPKAASMTKQTKEPASKLAKPAAFDLAEAGEETDFKTPSAVGNTSKSFDRKDSVPTPTTTTTTTTTTHDQVKSNEGGGGLDASFFAEEQQEQPTTREPDADEETGYIPSFSFSSSSSSSSRRTQRGATGRDAVGKDPLDDLFSTKPKSENSGNNNKDKEKDLDWLFDAKPKAKDKDQNPPPTRPVVDPTSTPTPAPAAAKGKPTSGYDTSSTVGAKDSPPIVKQSSTSSSSFADFAKAKDELLSELFPSTSGSTQRHKQPKQDYDEPSTKPSTSTKSSSSNSSHDLLAELFPSTDQRRHQPKGDKSSSSAPPPPNAATGSLGDQLLREVGLEEVVGRRRSTTNKDSKSTSDTFSSTATDSINEDKQEVKHSSPLATLFSRASSTSTGDRRPSTTSNTTSALERPPSPKSSGSSAPSPPNSGRSHQSPVAQHPPPSSPPPSPGTTSPKRNNFVSSSPLSKKSDDTTSAATVNKQTEFATRSSDPDSNSSGVGIGTGSSSRRRRGSSPPSKPALVLDPATAIETLVPPPAPRRVTFADQVVSTPAPVQENLPPTPRLSVAPQQPPTPSRDDDPQQYQQPPGSPVQAPAPVYHPRVSSPGSPLPDCVVHEQTIASQQSQIHQLQNLLSQLTKDKDQWQHESHQLHQQLDALQTQHNACLQDQSQLQKDKSQLQTQLDKTSQQDALCQQELVQLKTRHEVLQQELSQANHALAQSQSLCQKLQHDNQQLTLEFQQQTQREATKNQHSVDQLVQEVRHAIGNLRVLETSVHCQKDQLDAQQQLENDSRLRMISHLEGSSRAFATQAQQECVRLQTLLSSLEHGIRHLASVNLEEKERLRQEQLRLDDLASHFQSQSKTLQQASENTHEIVTKSMASYLQDVRMNQNRLFHRTQEIQEMESKLFEERANFSVLREEFMRQQELQREKMRLEEDRLDSKRAQLVQMQHQIDAKIASFGAEFDDLERQQKQLDQTKHEVMVLAQQAEEKSSKRAMEEQQLQQLKQNLLLGHQELDHRLQELQSREQALQHQSKASEDTALRLLGLMKQMDCTRSRLVQERRELINTKKTTSRITNQNQSPGQPPHATFTNRSERSPPPSVANAPMGTCAFAMRTPLSSVQSRPCSASMAMNIPSNQMPLPQRWNTSWKLATNDVPPPPLAPPASSSSMPPFSESKVMLQDPSGLSPSLRQLVEDTWQQQTRSHGDLRAKLTMHQERMAISCLGLDTRDNQSEGEVDSHAQMHPMRTTSHFNTVRAPPGTTTAAGIGTGTAPATSGTSSSNPNQRHPWQRATLRTRSNRPKSHSFAAMRHPPPVVSVQL